jgi:hypothetical protein
MNNMEEERSIRIRVRVRVPFTCKVNNVNIATRALESRGGHRAIKRSQ